ncbi:type II toxin-antitoxin system prevent-host-death family antitoxin [bacterium]|nr:type II toxin-antitoxin system prevent-host-death family antitoxin [bacterium]
MRTVSVREVRQQIGSLLDAVTAGEKVVITRRGKPIAKLTVIAPEESNLRFPDRSKFRAQISASQKTSDILIREMRDERG